MDEKKFGLIEELGKAIKPPFHLMSEEEGDEEFASLLQIVLASAEKIPRVNIRNHLNEIRGLSDPIFLSHFRLPRSLVYELIEQFEKSCIYSSLSTSGRARLSAEQHVLTMLWFVGHETGCYRNVANRFGVTLNSLFNILSRVSDFLISIGYQVIKFPSAKKKLESKSYFKNITGLPKVLGIIDDRHIRIDRLATSDDPDSYLNLKKYHSIHFQAIVNHECKFMHVFVGYPGSVPSWQVFHESGVPDLLPNICEGDYYLLGGLSYPCRRQLIVPYRNTELTNAERDFNEKLNSGCSLAKRTFDQLKQRFHFLCEIRLKTILRIIKLIYACCVLHNLSSSEDLAALDDKKKQAEKLKRMKRLKKQNETSSDEKNETDEEDADKILGAEEFKLSDDAEGSLLRDELCQKFRTSNLDTMNDVTSL